MATENVVLYRDQDTGETFNLDTNSGRRYDAAGNELPAWKMTDNEFSGLVADHVANTDARVRATSLRSGVGEAARPVLMNGRGTGRLVKMDLGTADVHIPSALPNFASGYSNEPPMADMYAPPLLTQKPSDKFYQYAKEDAFQLAMPMIGAGGAQVSEISPRITNASFTTEEFAIGGFVSTQLEAAQDAALQIRRATAERVLSAHHLQRELAVATLAQTSGTWDSTVVTTLDAAHKWNGGASADPVKDIQTLMRASWGKVTGLIMSGPCYDAFVTNPAVRAYYGYKDNAAPLPDPTQMKSLLRLPTIYVAEMQYIDSTGAKSYIWGNHVVGVRQPTEMPPTSQRDVASAYTFRWNGVDVKAGVASSGFIVREYFVQDRGSMGGNKIVVIRHDAPVQTSKFVGGLILNALA